MTREETVQFVRVIVNTYPNFKPNNLTELVDSWWLQLKEDDFKLMGNALIAFNRTNTTGYPPTIGQLIDMAGQLINPKMTGYEAWKHVRKAINGSAYESQERWNELPGEVKKTVTPEQLYLWAISENFNENVVMSQYIKSFEVRQMADRNADKIPQSVRVALDSIKNNLMLEGKHER